MNILKKKVMSEEDMISMLSKHNKQKVVPGKSYIFTVTRNNTRVVFSKNHWKFCNKDITVFDDAETHGYDYTSTIFENGTSLMWVKEWFTYL